MAAGKRTYVSVGGDFPDSRRRLSLVTLLVRDYDEAIDWFTRVLGLFLIEDTDLGDVKRWVRVSPSADAASSAALLLAEAKDTGQIGSIGTQGGGRVCLFLETDNCIRDHVAMSARGVRFRESPRFETYGTVVVFEDLYGNLWDLIGPPSGNDGIEPGREAGRHAGSAL